MATQIVEVQSGRRQTLDSGDGPGHCGGEVVATAGPAVNRTLCAAQQPGGKSNAAGRHHTLGVQHVSDHLQLVSGCVGLRTAHGPVPVERRMPIAPGQFRPTPSETSPRGRAGDLDRAGSQDTTALRWNAEREAAVEQWAHHARYDGIHATQRHKDESTIPGCLHHDGAAVGRFAAGRTRRSVQSCHLPIMGGDNS
jgi:hypothetical protein